MLSEQGNVENKCLPFIILWKHFFLSSLQDPDKPGDKPKVQTYEVDLNE